MSKENPKAYRNDAYAKVTGRAKYTDDIKIPFMLYAVPVYSEYVYAGIISIDSSEAENYPGVVKVLTHRNVPGLINSRCSSYNNIS